MKRSLVVVAFALAACNGGSGFSGSSAKKSTPAPQNEAIEREEVGGIETVTAVTNADATGVVQTSTDTAFDQRLEQQGAQSGDIQVSLLWNNLNDLDLHVVGPTGEHIFYAAATDSIGGFLDVDMNAGDEGASMTPVENVFWTAGQAARGQYKIYVHHFLNRGTENPSAFKIRLKVGESVSYFDGSVAYDEGAGFSGGGDDSGFGGDGGFSGTSPLPANAALVHQFNY